MESNEISMFMDVKLDIHDKKPEMLKFKSWVKCLVKIEAIKCLPCFLRITFIRNVEDETANLSVSINIPGVTISLATSRTKQHSYGIFWIKNRKRCFIYFAVESEASCRRHMKWMKKSIKNLELHRQIFLETRRSSRGRLESSTNFLKTLAAKQDRSNDSQSKQNPQAILGPLPKIPDIADSKNLSRRVSSVSGIYEEIFDNGNEPPRVCQRFSNTSIASGIYEEMKPITLAEFNAITEEAALTPVPPLPPRKRINTFETDLDSIPRSNTTPESELVKKKKYKNVLDNIFGRSKRRYNSVSECQVSCAGDLIAGFEVTRDNKDKELYVNVKPSFRSNRHPLTGRFASNAVKQQILDDRHLAFAQNKRNSFSSPDLSKINYLQEVEAVSNLSSLSSDLFGEELDTSPIEHCDLGKQCEGKTESLHSLNISEHIQPNFNFSCNSSTINLVGANLVVRQAAQTQIIIDDLSGYCAMAPIKKNEPKKTSSSSLTCSSATSSSSSTSPNNDSDKENEEKLLPPQTTANESGIYENMAALNTSGSESSATHSNIYENLIGRTSAKNYTVGEENVAEESYYQAPRKTIISIDDKVPSYYPNSRDKTRRRSRSPSSMCCTNPAEKPTDNELRHLINIKVTRHENLYISSPQKIIDQRFCAASTTTTTSDDQKKKTTGSPLMARKIADNVYTVTHCSADDVSAAPSPTSSQLIHLAALQNIDFKFDDTKNESDLMKSTATTPTGNCLQTAENASRIYQKYATLARITSPSRNHLQSNNNHNNSSHLQNNSSKFMERLCNTKATPSQTNSAHKPSPIAGDLTGVRKFTSLPRFKKIDFSPLKIKINNVLQRHSPHNSEV